MSISRKKLSRETYTDSKKTCLNFIEDTISTFPSFDNVNLHFNKKGSLKYRRDISNLLESIDSKQETSLTFSSDCSIKDLKNRDIKNDRYIKLKKQSD